MAAAAAANELLFDPRTQMTQFREFIARKYSVALVDYRSLWQWSIDNYTDFWSEARIWLDVRGSVEPTAVCADLAVRMDEIPIWFPGMLFNYAERMLFPAGVAADKLAVIACGGEVPTVKATYGELRSRVAAVAASLVALGVGKGDRVAGYLPNCLEALVAMLATASLGAIWTSTSMDFGVGSVLDRFSQVNPKILISANAVRYNGKLFDHTDKLAAVVSGLASSGLSGVVVVEHIADAPAMNLARVPHARVMLWSAMLALGEPARPLTFEQVPFNTPLFIMYSSGTTGTPKCMVHSAGGTLLQQKKEHVFHGDARPDDVIFFYTTVGWMMWQWLVAALSVGATVVLFEGAPVYPGPHTLWDMADEHGVTIFGTSPKYLSALEASSYRPIASNKLTALRAVLSTGAPLQPSQFDFVYRAIKARVLLGSISGGTDIISCFAGSNPDLPVYRGEIQAPNLGMAVYAYGSDGKPVYDQRGDLVCSTPFPSMPVFFWNDPEGAKYRKAYFAAFPHVWAHGDYCIVSSRTGGLIMLGRSDGTLNPGGVRFGSAEIYRVLEGIPDVLDSVCIGQHWNGDERVVLFIKLRPGADFSPELVAAIKAKVRQDLSARHVPAKILPVAEIPYTINGKKVEIAVRQIVHGEVVAERGQLANPDVLDAFTNIPELAQE